MDLVNESVFDHENDESNENNDKHETASMIMGHFENSRYSDASSLHEERLEDFLARHAPPAAVTEIQSLPFVRTVGKQISDFYVLCQKQGIQPYFEFTEKSQACFSVKVQFGDETLEDPGPFPSKRIAKETLAARALEKLRGSNPFAMQDRSRKRKQGLLEEDDLSHSVSEVDDSENWVQLIYEYSQKRSLDIKYQEYKADTRHLQRRGIPNSGLQFSVALTIGGYPEVFGGETSLFNSKTLAKRNAAREAVLHIRRTDPSLIEPSRNKRVKSNRHSLGDVKDGETGLTPFFDKLDMNETVPFQVVKLAEELGFKAPRYELKPSSPPPGVEKPTNGSFVSMAAFFYPEDEYKERRLVGPIGKVNHVYGKKNAKGQCAVAVLELLKSLRGKERQPMDPVFG